jgi:hypothetical protein
MLDGSNERDLTAPAAIGATEMPAASTAIRHTARAEEAVAECDHAYRVATADAEELEAQLVEVSAATTGTPMGVLLAHDRLRGLRLDITQAWARAAALSDELSGARVALVDRQDGADPEQIGHTTLGARLASDSERRAA